MYKRLPKHSTYWHLESFESLMRNGEAVWNFLGDLIPGVYAFYCFVSVNIADRNVVNSEVHMK